MKRCVLLMALLLALGQMAACSLTDPPAPGTPAAADQPQGQAMGLYLDFDDVQLPAGMKLDKEKSSVMRVGDFKAGVLVLSDNLEVQSLVNYFVQSMAKDNWTLKCSMKYPTVALFFCKKGKTCIIRITESTFTTDVEVWVAPSE